MIWRTVSDSEWKTYATIIRWAFVAVLITHGDPSLLDAIIGMVGRIAT